MSEAQLTQELIDGIACEEQVEKKRGLYAAVANHPFITGGLVLAGAGLAYAVGRKVINADDSEVAREVHVETAIAINKTPEELYSFWRELTNLPLFMRNVEAVTDLGGGKSHWVAKSIGGGRVEWDAEIYNDVPNETIAWRSLENADVVNAGAVNFKKAPEGRGTYVNVSVNYNPPAGKLGATIAQLFGAEPKQMIHEGLRRLKQHLEAGEVPTIIGQTSGRAAEDETESMEWDMSENEHNATAGDQTEERTDEARGAKPATGNVEQGAQHQTGGDQGDSNRPTSAKDVGDEAKEQHETRAA